MKPILDTDFEYRVKPWQTEIDIENETKIEKNQFRIQHWNWNRQKQMPIEKIEKLFSVSSPDVYFILYIKYLY